MSCGKIVPEGARFKGEFLTRRCALRPTRKHAVLVSACAAILFLADPGASDQPAMGIDIHLDPGSAKQPGQTGSGTHMKLSGVVSKIESGLVFVTTPTGRLTVSSKAIRAVCKVGDKVTMWMNEGNVVIDVHKEGKPSPHRFITGSLTYVSDDKNEILLWTPEGEKPFPVERGKSKLSAVKDGTPITAELNEEGRIIDIHQVR